MRQHPISGTLIFLKPIASDAGYYQCFADNIHGVASSNIVTLKNEFVNKVDQKEVEVVEVNLGYPARLTCDVPDAFPELEVTWSKLKPNGALRVLRGRRLTVDPKGSLWFTNVTIADSFRNDSYYACLLNSKALNRFIIGNRVQLKVLPLLLKRQGYPPVRQFVSTDQSTEIGGKTEFFCIYGGTPLPETNWTKDGELIEFSARIKLENFGRSLVILNTTEADKGMYACEVWNEKAGKFFNNFKLDVEVAPSFIKEPESLTMLAGSIVSFECEAVGVPAPTTEWIFNSKPIDQAPENHNRTVTRDRIIIRNVFEDDVGNYGCNASNSRGYVYKEFHLNVIEVSTAINVDEAAEEEKADPELKREEQGVHQEPEGTENETRTEEAIETTTLSE
jgi:neuronal cell adhesion molecule